MVDREGVVWERSLSTDTVLFRQWPMKYYTWIGDDRWQIRKNKALRLWDFRYGLYKEVVYRAGVTPPGPREYIWEFQDCYFSKWTARFALWKLRRHAGAVK